MSMRLSGAPRGRAAGVTLAALVVLGGVAGGVAGAIGPAPSVTSTCGTTLAHSALSLGKAGRGQRLVSDAYVRSVSAQPSCTQVAKR